MKTAQKWQVVKLFEGLFNEDCLALEEEELPDLEYGDVLLEAVYLSLDPYNGVILVREKKTNTTVVGQQVARVTKSKDKDYKVGDLYIGQFGWRTHTIINPGKGVMMGNAKDFTETRPIPDIGNLPVSLCLGAMGMPGVTAHLAVGKCNPKPGETVFVSSAAGVVGSVAGQIAKLKGCRVIGAAGSEEKLAWLKEIGFDHVFNYKKRDLDSALKEYAPNGIDIYIELVGGEFGLTVLMNHMAIRGRVAAVGSISTFNQTLKPHSHDIMMKIIVNNLQIKAVQIFYEEKEKYAEAEKELIQWTKEGKLQYKERVIGGFANTCDAYMKMMRGDYYGKTIVKVSTD